MLNPLFRAAGICYPPMKLVKRAINYGVLYDGMNYQYERECFRTESSFHAVKDQCYFTTVVDYRYLVYVIFMCTILAPTFLIIFCYISIYGRIRKEEIQVCGTTIHRERTVE